MDTEELTGRRRYRKFYPSKWYDSEPVLILQVEYSRWSPVYNAHICYWRDGREEDLTEAVVEL